MNGTKMILTILGIIIGIGFMGVLFSEGIKFCKSRIMRDNKQVSQVGNPDGH